MSNKEIIKVYVTIIASVVMLYFYRIILMDIVSELLFISSYIVVMIPLHLSNIELMRNNKHICTCKINENTKKKTQSSN